MGDRVPSTDDAVEEAHKILDEMEIPDGSLALRTIILAGKYRELLADHEWCGWNADDI